jgi:hypothetical protein
VAYILDAGVAKAAPSSPLARVDLSLARDTLVLALKGSRPSARDWNVFKAECPADARLVEQWVAADQAEKRQLTAEVNDRLLRAEELLVKSKKPKDGDCLQCGAHVKTKHKHCRECGAVNKFHQSKGEVRVREKKLRKRQARAQRQVSKAAAVSALTKTAGRPVKTEAQAVRAYIASDLDSPDPARREAARAVLG